MRFTLCFSLCAGNSVTRVRVFPLFRGFQGSSFSSVPLMGTSCVCGSVCWPKDKLLGQHYKHHSVLVIHSISEMRSVLSSWPSLRALPPRGPRARSRVPDQTNTHLPVRTVHVTRCFVSTRKWVGAGRGPRTEKGGSFRNLRDKSTAPKKQFFFRNKKFPQPRTQTQPVL